MSSPGYRDDGAHSPNFGPNFEQVSRLAADLAARGEVSETRLFQHSQITARATTWLTKSETSYTEPTHEVNIPIGPIDAYLSVDIEGLVRFRLSDNRDRFADAQLALAPDYFMPEEQARMTADFLRLFADEFIPDEPIQPAVVVQLQRKLAEIIEFSSASAKILTPSLETVADLKEAISDIADNAPPVRIATLNLDLPDREEEYNRQLQISGFSSDGWMPDHNQSIDYSFSSHPSYNDYREVRIIAQDGLVMARAGAAWGFGDELSASFQALKPEDFTEPSEKSALEKLIARGFRYADQEDIDAIYGVLIDAAAHLENPGEQ